jgi:hypothetical protein
MVRPYPERRRSRQGRRGGSSRAGFVGLAHARRDQRAGDEPDRASIEHEDQLVSMDEGLRKEIELVQTVVIREEKPKMWWA